MLTRTPCSLPKIDMPSHSTPSRRTATVTLVTCFVIGLTSAHGAHALETQQAVAQARETASSVQAQQAALTASLERAHATVRLSASAREDAAVAQAASALESTAEHAATVAMDHEVPQVGPPHVNMDAATALVQVLDGDVDAPEVARAANDELTQMHDELDQARTQLEVEVHELSQATDAAKHEATLATLDDELESLPAHIEWQSQLITQVGSDTTDSVASQRAAQSLAELESALAVAQLVDRSDVARVDAVTGEVMAAHATLTAHMHRLADTHQEWVDARNSAIDDHNNAVLVTHEQTVRAALDDHIEANRAAVAARQNGWSGQPAGITGANGRLPANDLCDVDFAVGHRLQCDAAASLAAANASYRAQTGKDLVMTDSYRSYGLQVRTRALKPRTAGVPGTSNHGWGMAVDLDHDSARWLARNGADFGWVHPRWARAGGAKPEWWHLEYVAADVGGFVAPDPAGLAETVANVFTAGTSSQSK